MVRSWFGPLAVLTGLLWGLRGWVALADPRYWSPRAPVDYAALILFSAALISLAVSLWWLRVVPIRSGPLAGRLATGGLLAAGVANLIEDGLGLRVFGIVYIAGVLVGTFAIIPLGLGLVRQTASRWLGGLALVTVPGLIWMSTWPGTLLLVSVWVVAGLTVMRRGLPRQEGRDTAQGG